jgi:fatty acid desaturase
MRTGRLVIALLLLLLLPLALIFLSAFWFPLLLLVVVVGLALWVVRHYYLDYLDEPEASRTGP